MHTALLVLMILIVLGLWVAGFVMYSKIPSDDESAKADQDMALAFAVVGIPFPILQLVPIIIGARY